MRVKEALEVLEIQDKCSQGDCPDVDSCVVCPYNVSDVEFREAYDMAISALRKQVPEKLIAEGDGYADGEMVYDSFYCPSCDHRMEEDEVKDYCPECGQKICWEDEQ